MQDGTAQLDFCYNGCMEHDAAEQPTHSSSLIPHSSSWRGAVDAADALVACIDALGIVPLRGDGPWLTLLDVRAPGVTLAEVWKWGGALVAARQAFCGRVLGGADGLAFVSLELFPAFFALAPGVDYTRVYMNGQIGITAKAIADLLFVKGPMRVQQIRQGIRLHKRFLAHDVPGALAELECALVIVAGGPELVKGWQIAPSAGPGPRSRWSRQVAQDLDLRVWELTARWAPPELLAAADRLRDRPDAARTALLARAQALAPATSEAATRHWLGWD